ncbi:nitroreductase [Laetiporus sulphureus 93-53]|uniref:Nitroreductase n=1 Tax=Laetiporus sulphureus 93-53 TaxID=1314785 RepID=A0A165D1L5_9APHY|nr:nitroreductase [Laetiporus sulphureus 93-53]KZT03966.1 nitroreductase [Laetiporus sulphureus 93-53]
MSFVKALRSSIAPAVRTHRTVPSSLLASTRAARTASPFVHQQTRTMASAQFLEEIKKRRTYYNISNKSPIPDARVEEIVKQIVLNVPSSFNSQSSRVVVLFKKEHEKLWDFASEILKPIVPEQQWPTTAGKLASFKAGYGTILFFEDQVPVRELQKNFPLYQESFPAWSEHTSGMIQFATWTSLELEGFGASLQHYNPLIDQKVKSEWNIPDSWNLIAQMPFGTPSAPPTEKKFSPIEERVKVFGNL